MIEKKTETIEKAVKYKHIGIFTEILSIIPLALLHKSVFGYVLAIPIFIIGVYIERKFRCPYCRFVFDSRSRLSDLSYCPKCGEKLNVLKNESY